MKLPSPANRLPAAPCERLHHTVWLRLPMRSGELSTCVLRAARWRCQCWRGHSRLIDRRCWCAGCTRVRTKWLAGRRVEIFSAARAERMAHSGADGFFEGVAREKAAGTSKKCAWSRSERQPFCGGLALNDWRAEAAQRGRLAASAQCARVCAHYVPTCLPLQVSVVRCKAAFKVAQRACALSLLSFARSFHVAGQCPTSFLCTAPWRTIWRASFCGP